MDRRIVYVIEDEDVIRDDIENLLGSHGYDVRAFSGAKDFFKAWDRSLNGCMLLDIRMPESSGLDILAKLGEASKILPIILFTSMFDMQMAVQAGKSGVFDYCPKPYSPELVLEKVANALRENEERLGEHQANVKTLEALAQLTAREREVLEHLCEGKSSKEIARELGVSPFTIDNHRAKIMVKMGLNSISQVVQKTFKALQSRGSM